MLDYARLAYQEQLWNGFLLETFFTHVYHFSVTATFACIIGALLYVWVKQILHEFLFILVESFSVVDFVELSASFDLVEKAGVQIVLSLGVVGQWQPNHQNYQHNHVNTDSAAVIGVFLLSPLQPVNLPLLVVNETRVSPVVVSKEVQTALLLPQDDHLAS